MAGLSSAQKDTILDATLVVGLFASLHDSDPGGVGAGEAAGGAYARQSMVGSWAASAGGTKANSAAVTFAGMPAGTWTHVGFWDALVAGNFVWGGVLSVPKSTGAGDSVVFAIGAITGTFTP